MLSHHEVTLLRKIRRGGLTEVGVALVEEVYHWGLGFEGSEAQAKPSQSLSLSVCLSVCQPPLRLSFLVLSLCLPPSLPPLLSSLTPLPHSKLP